MQSYWETSWESLDADRLAAYIAAQSMEPDALMKEMAARNVRTVCDAGYGCGIYALRLARNGFQVSGFDVSRCAVRIAEQLLRNASAHASLKTASALDTGYEDGQFDCVVCRDVIDHMSAADGMAAIRELFRITKDGGILLLTLDHIDEEYEREPHSVSESGDYVFIAGKWQGMVFHPYTKEELLQMLPADANVRIEESSSGFVVWLMKPAME